MGRGYRAASSDEFITVETEDKAGRAVWSRAVVLVVRCFCERLGLVSMPSLQCLGLSTPTSHWYGLCCGFCSVVSVLSFCLKFARGHRCLGATMVLLYQQCPVYGTHRLMYVVGMLHCTYCWLRLRSFTSNLFCTACKLSNLQVSIARRQKGFIMRGVPSSTVPRLGMYF